MSEGPYSRRPDDWTAPQPTNSSPAGDPYQQPAPYQYQSAPQDASVPAPQYQSMPTPQSRPQRVSVRPMMPVVTIGIIAVCALVWLGELGSREFLARIALAPDLGLVEPWRLVTSAFAHSTQVMHIAFNMMALWSLGQGLELALGRARFSALYLLSALGGSVAFVLTAILTGDLYTYVVGASGAVFGLFGALLPIQRQVGISSRSLWLTLALNAVIGFTIPGIAWQAHLGGFLTGLACGWLMMKAVTGVRRGEPDRTWGYLGGVALVLVALFGSCYALI